MRSRAAVLRIAVAVVAVGLVTDSSGCSSQQKATKVPQKTARITVNDNSRTSHAVSCTQLQWSLTVDITAAPAHVRAVLQLEPDKLKPQSVNFDDFNGFTGQANAGLGNAEATFADGTYHITGTAQGSNPDNPDVPTTADFTIDTTC